MSKSQLFKETGVSVLIPARDAESTLAACLESVRRQTGTGFECVVVDDGSTDGTGEIARRAARKDPRFHVVRLAPSGLVAALGAGVSRCRGAFVARLDADDWMRRDRLASQRAAFDADPTLDLVGSHVRFFPRETLGPGFREYERWLNGFRTPEAIARERFIECPLAHPSWMLRRETLERLGGYRDAGWPEDYDLLLRLIESGGRAGVVPRRLVGWSRRPRRLSATDARYSLDAFTACRASFLASGPLRGSSGYVLWGYGQTGRALRRALDGHGKRMTALIEVHPGRVGQTIHGAPVVGADDAAGLPCDPLVVSVAGAGPRDLIRARLRALGRVEGKDYWCAA